MTSSVNQVAASNSQTDAVDELVRTLRHEIAILKFSDNRRRTLSNETANSTTLATKTGTGESMDQSRNRYDSSERNGERRSRDYDNRSNSRDRNGCSKSRSIRFEDDRGRQQHDNRASITDKRSTLNNPPQSNNGTSRQTNNSGNRNNPGSNSRNQNQESRYCKHKNHASNDCKACCNCLRVGYFYFRWEFRDPKAHQAN